MWRFRKAKNFSIQTRIFFDLLYTDAKKFVHFMFEIWPVRNRQDPDQCLGPGPYVNPDATLWVLVMDPIKDDKIGYSGEKADERNPHPWISAFFQFDSGDASMTRLMLH